MCCICYEMWPSWCLWQDRDGLLVDICFPCAVQERYSIMQRLEMAKLAGEMRADTRNGTG